MTQADFIAKYQKAYQKITAANRILLVTHYNPDGDSLSALCAMAELLEQLGKNYLALAPTEPSAVFYFLPHFEKIRHFTEKPKLSDGQSLGHENFRRFDLIIVMDCGSIGRTLLTEEIKQRSAGQFLIEFDHHPKIDDYADLEIREPAAAAACEILYYFFQANRVKINKHLANCLLTGILTDTGNFLFPSTTEGTVKIASEMLGHGARLPKIMENTLRNKSLAAMRLWGKVMAGLKINDKYNIAVTTITEEEASGRGIDREDVDGISNFLGNLYGVRAVLFLRQEAGGKIRGNFRTADPAVDVSRLARILGGGGHAKAAGFTIEGRLERTEKGWKIV